MENLSCNRIIVCWDHQKRPCLRPKGHKMGCNPFSSGPLASDNKTISWKQIEIFHHQQKDDFGRNVLPR